VDEPVGLTAEQLVTVRDLWQIVSRQIEQMLCSREFTGKIEINCLKSRVRNYVPAPTIVVDKG
jgi:hypothetical protein